MSGPVVEWSAESRFFDLVLTRTDPVIAETVVGLTALNYRAGPAGRDA